MLTIEAIRLEESLDGTVSVLRIEKELQCFILENCSWQNKPFLSCIPPGVYTCKRINSPKFGNTFEIINVPGRTDILFHAGNTSNDTAGCLLTGRRLGYLKDKRAVLESRFAFKEFMKRLDDVKEFKIVITENF